MKPEEQLFFGWIGSFLSGVMLFLLFQRPTSTTGEVTEQVSSNPARLRQEEEEEIERTDRRYPAGDPHRGLRG